MMFRSLCLRSLAPVLLLAAHAAWAAAAGTVVGLNGTCLVGSSPAKLGQPVQIGDMIDVPADGKLKLRLEDGSVVSVASGTRVSVSSLTVNGAGQRQEARLTLAQGLLRAVVAPTAQPAPFEVDTAVGSAAVRSTDWFVGATPGGMRVGVLTGSVDMKSTATGHAVTIPAHWGARLEAGRDPVPPRRWEDAEFADVIGRTNLK